MKTNRATQNDRLEPKVRSRLRIAKSHLNRNTPDGAAKAHPRILPTRISRFDDAMSSHSVISSSLDHPRLSPTINVSDNTTVTLLRRSKRSIEDSFGRE